MIRAVSGWFYLVNLGGAFHAFPFPTKLDAEEALHALKAGVP